MITNNFSNYFNLNKNNINTELSVQSMVDRTNPFGTYFKINEIENWVGMPLRVHRRCINPMFDIANRIAYNNSMFCATLEPKNININFKTSFIHCQGNVSGRHFVEEQAKIIKEILDDEFSISKGLPNIFVITPFSEISRELKKYLGKYNIDNQWLKTHIGTVHTFQGKEAEGVILCLGLDKNSKGAANWASQKPNLLNVALTRAKYRFIAIGDKEIWLNKPYFTQLNELSKNSKLSIEV